jgi:hypothetical protein
MYKYYDHNQYHFSAKYDVLTMVNKKITAFWVWSRIF